MSKVSIVVAVVALIAIGAVLYVKRPSTQEDSNSQQTLPYDSSMPAPTSSLIPSSTPMSPDVPSSSPVSLSDVKPIASVVQVTLKTSKGDITLNLNGAKAPMAVGNFVYLANQHFYDGVTFHRVIPDFMIQAGDPLSKNPALREQHGTGDPGYEFKNEPNDLKFVRGSLGMANSGPDTNGSQFFIVTGQAFPDLDGGYTNFGTVVSGMDVVDAISKVERDSRDNPLEAVTIQQVIVSETK